MAKRIVFCCDGTWQTARNNTNVYLLYKGLTVTSDQVTFYDDGVGTTGGAFEKLAGGAIGEGLLKKIVESYTKIAHIYEPGDEIFLFGFSRGAFTARSLAGWIAACGLPSGKFDDPCIAVSFSAYRDPANRATLLAGLGACGLTTATVRMVGVWDTVGALGIPAIFGGFDERRYGFLDTGLHPCIKNAFQCLAIDEHRRQFPATLWTSPPAPDQTIEQVWFTGCHGDVGGGTPQAGGVDAATRLCDIPLGWMLMKAQSLGLAFAPEATAHYGRLPEEYALDAYTDSWSKTPFGAPLARSIAADAALADSVAVRVQYALSYAPSNLSINEGALANSYKIVQVMDRPS